MSVAVSIVSFNTKVLLENCLKALQAQKTQEQINIWVLDNDSKDGSPQMVEEKFPEVKLIKSEKNLGFAKGQNQVLKQVKDKYVVLLNPDTQFENNFIDEMVNFMEKNPNCLISGGKLVDFNNRLESNGGDFPFGAALFNWLFNLEFLGNTFSLHRNDKEYYSVAHEVDWVSGTMMVLRRESLEKIGYFNEDFFMYFEDVELCYRAKKSWGKVMINPDVIIKHKSGSSSGNPRFAQWKGEFAGLITFYKWNRGFLGALYARILIYLAILLRILAFLVTGKVNKSATYAKVLVSI